MRASGNPSVLVADDDPAIARSIGRLVGKHFTAHVVTDLSTLAAAIDHYQTKALLFDLLWGRHAALPELEQLVRSHPHLRVCVHTGHGAPSLVSEVFRRGAHGCLLKPATVDELCLAVRVVMSGELYLGPGLAENAALWQAIRDGKRLISVMPALEFGSKAFDRAVAWFAFETGRSHTESVVVVAVANGMSKKLIASRMKCAESTVAGHVAAFYAHFRRSHGIVNAAVIGRWVEDVRRRMPAEWEPD